MRQVYATTETKMKDGRFATFEWDCGIEIKEPGGD